MSSIALLAAFGAGIFAASIGALPVFILTGITAIIGAGIAMAGAEDVVVGFVSFGILLGPHITFAAAVAATAYSGKKKTLDSGANILESMGRTGDPSALIVGGVFGTLGYLINYLFANVMALQTDTIALTVVTSAIIARLIFGSTGLFGKYEGEGKRAYMPKGKALAYNIIWGAGLGLLVGGIVSIVADAVGLGVASHIPVLVWGISAVSLIFTQTGFAVPGSHHVTISSGLAAVALATSTGGIAVLVAGAAFGAIAAMVGDFGGGLLNSHCDSHIDPPAFSIAICTTLVLLLL